MSILHTPQAKALLDEATVSPGDVASCDGRLETFLKRYLPLFYRKEQRVNAGVVVRGLLSDIERKTCEPVAYREQRHAPEGPNDRRIGPTGQAHPILRLSQAVPGRPRPLGRRKGDGRD